MCDPMTILAVGAAGQLVGAYASISQSQSQASALKANANADLQKGYADELDQRAKDRTALASQLNTLSGRGIDVSTGTPLDLLRASARNQEVDALRIRADGINKYNAQRAQASGVLKNGLLTAGGQLLSGAFSVSKLAGLGAMTPTPATPTPTRGALY